MTWSKYRNRKPKRKMDRTDADIMAAKQMIIDGNLGYKTVEKTYEEISDKLCRKPSRNIF